MNRNTVGRMVLAAGMFLAPACPAQFLPGDMITYNQNAWGNPTAAAGVILSTHFDKVYFSAGGVLEVGLLAGFTMTFQSPTAVFNYMPSAGPPGPLTANLVDPISSTSGQFGGEVVALKANVDFSDAGHTMGALGLPFGDLVIRNLAAPPQLNGQDVRHVLADANVALSGGMVGYSIPEANALLLQLNASFEAGIVTSWAQQHLGVPCYADCNSDGPLTVADFGCFQTRFVAGDMYADCNGDGALTVSDFGCFQSAFVAGCL